MAKRVAGNDLNHENWDIEDDPEDAGSFKRAGADVLKTRVFKTARRRNPIGSSPASASSTAADESTEKRNVFGDFTGFSKAPVSTTAAFGFIFNKNNTTKTILDSQPKVNGISHLNTITMDAPVDDKQHDEAYFSRLKGLNSSVASWIKRHVDENPFVNLKPVFQDYERYFDELELKKNSGQLNKTTDTKSNDTATTASTRTTSKAPQFSFGIKPTTINKDKPQTDTVDTTKSPQSKLMFGSGAPSSNLTSMFSFGQSQATTSTTSGSTTSSKFSFGVSPAPLTTSASSTTSMFKPPPPPSASGFSFGGGVTSTPTAPFPFTSVSVSSSTSKTGTETGTSLEADEDEPPKVEFTPVDEDGHVYKVRCKVFVKKDKEKSFGDRGVGNMFLKPIPNSEKMQLIVRADTNLGNVLCNFVLSTAIPTKRMGKKDVMLVCVPTPDVAPPPVPILLRVKSPEEADKLLAILEKHKK